MPPPSQPPLLLLLIAVAGPLPMPLLPKLLPLLPLVVACLLHGVCASCKMSTLRRSRNRACGIEEYQEYPSHPSPEGWVVIWHGLLRTVMDWPACVGFNSAAALIDHRCEEESPSKLGLARSKPRS